jgi:hypothetical protein
MLREMTENNPTSPLANTYWVVPGQFLAGEHPGDADEEIAGRRLSALRDAGIRTFIDLTAECEINEDAKPVPPYSSLLRSLADGHRFEITYMRIPISDQGIPSVWTMRCILDVLDRSISDENPVYVHCWSAGGQRAQLSDVTTEGRA